MAEREGKFLVELFDRIGKQNGGKAFSANGMNLGDPFVYRHLGSMASVGHYKALVDLRQSKVISAVTCVAQTFEEIRNLHLTLSFAGTFC